MVRAAGPWLSTRGSNRWADNGGNGSATFDFDDDLVASAAVGLRQNSHLRVAGEIAHRTNELEPIPLDLDNGQIETWSAMVHVFLDFNPRGTIQPYIGAGAGVALIDADLFNSDNPEIINDSAIQLAFQGVVGVAYQFSPRIAVDLGYRYFTFHGAEFGGTDGGDPETWDVDCDQQSVTLGLRWQFDAG